MTAFIDRFIALLRRAIYTDPGDRVRAQILAGSLERRRLQPRGDGFDIDVTGDDEKDREILAAWIEAGAHAPAFCSPACGRNFSEETSALLRHRLDGEVMGYERAREIVWDERINRRSS